MFSPTLQTAPLDRRAALRRLALTVALAHAPRVLAAAPRTVDSANKPGELWRANPTRTVADLTTGPTSLRPDAGLTRFGGLASHRRAATGFFRTEKIGPRWWLIDPEGGPFLHRGVVSVRPPSGAKAAAAFLSRFGDARSWARQTAALLAKHGFNGLGGWSDVDAFAAVEPHLAGTRLWNFMTSFGRQLGLTFMQAGHAGFRGDAIPVFDPAFEAFADEYARQLAPFKGDPWLLGHFTDNELPLNRKALANFLTAPCPHGQRAAREFLIARHGSTAGASDITDADSSAFIATVVDRYFRIVSTAIRRHDPHHLVLGSRFHTDLSCPELFSASGRHVDVVSVNYYHAWTPDAAKLAMWERESQRPVIISEWYAKAADSGLANTSGAGWLVRTQADRGLFYQNFALGLLESRVCVGWHWFKYSDNDPLESGTDPSNRDSNKGIVTAAGEPYEPLLAAMQTLNERTYAIAEFFDRHP